MFSNKLVFALIVLFSLSVSGLTFGQDEEVKHLYMVWEMNVDPALDKDFRDVVKEIVAKDQEYNLGYSYFVHSSNTFVYTTFLPLKNYADWDNYLAAWKRVSKAMGAEESKTLYDKLNNNVESFDIYTLRFRPGLSNMPENPRLTTDQEKFFRLNIMYPKLNKIKEFESAMKKSFHLVKKKKIQRK